MKPRNFSILIILFVINLSNQNALAAPLSICDSNLLISSSQIKKLVQNYNRGSIIHGDQKWEWLFPKSGYMAGQQSLLLNYPDQIHKYPYDSISAKLAQALLASLIPYWGARGHLLDLTENEWVSVAFGPDLERSDFFMKIANFDEGNWISSDGSFTRVWKSYFKFSESHNRRITLFDPMYSNRVTTLIHSEFHPEKLLFIFKSDGKKIKVIIKFEEKIPKELIITKLPPFPFSDLFSNNEFSVLGSRRFDLTTIRLNENEHSEIPKFDYPRENILFSGNSEYPF